MNATITVSKDNELLQETATRLIKALGVDMAIFICRSNYWHGVLQLILDQKSSLTAAADVEPVSEPIRLHSLPRTTVQPVRRYANAQELPIAA